MGDFVNLLETVVDAIWKGLEDEPLCEADRDGNYIEVGMPDIFSMERVAAHVIAMLGLTEEFKHLDDGWASMPSTGPATFKPPTRVRRLVSNWVADSPHTAT